MTCCDKMQLLEAIGSVTIYSDGVVNKVDSKFNDEWPTSLSNIICAGCRTNMAGEEK